MPAARLQRSCACLRVPCPAMCALSIKKSRSALDRTAAFNQALLCLQNIQRAECFHRKLATSHAFAALVACYCIQGFTT